MKTLNEHLYEVLFRGEKDDELRPFKQLLGDDLSGFLIEIDGDTVVFPELITKERYNKNRFTEDVLNKIVTATHASSKKKIRFEHHSTVLAIDKGIDFKDLEIECVNHSKWHLILSITCTKKGLVPLTNIKNLDMNGHTLRFYRSPKLINVHIENANKITFEHTISLSPCKNSTIQAARIILDASDKQHVLSNKLNKLLDEKVSYNDILGYVLKGNETVLNCIGWDPKSYNTQHFDVNLKFGYTEAKI